MRVNRDGRKSGGASKQEYEWEGLLLSARAIAVLERNGVHSVADARRLTREQLLRHTPNCGVKTLAEIEKAIGLTPSQQLDAADSRIAELERELEREASVFGLVTSDVLAPLAQQSGVPYGNATRLLYAIARADSEVTDAVIVWLMREKLRTAVATKEKAARAARKDSGT